MKGKGSRDVFVARALHILLSRAVRNAIVYCGRLVRRGIRIAHKGAITTRRRHPTVVVSNRFSADSSHNFERLIPDASLASRIVQVSRCSNGGGLRGGTDSGRVASIHLFASRKMYERPRLLSIART